MAFRVPVARARDAVVQGVAPRLLTRCSSGVALGARREVEPAGAARAEPKARVRPVRRGAAAAPRPPAPFGRAGAARVAPKRACRREATGAPYAARRRSFAAAAARQIPVGPDATDEIAERRAAIFAARVTRTAT